MISLAVLMLLVGTSHAALETRGGVIVDVINDCEPEDPYSCGDGYCCVKDDYVYLDGYTGERPAYRLQCQPLREEGEWCLGHIGGPVCPCAAEFECRRSNSFLRRCTRTY
ncbi:uncharacterized protein LOC135482305 [Liolophura sinensis]|uniref:uncharacterized protein LOC135482305 n=1 Tax=Liolophura sinensis TaxID=3198878 RepID=UPI003157FA3D